MCARATLTRKQLREVAEELDADFSDEDARLYRPRFNAAPSDTLWVLRHSADHRIVMPAIWGYLANGRPLINVRGERVGSGGGFREAFASRRCGMICDGFYEWNKRHEPTWFHRADGGLIVLGGLYHGVPAPSTGARFTILTTRPNRVVAAVHDRMPLVLPPDRIDDWLVEEAPSVLDLIVSAPEDTLVATPVSTRVNSVRNDDPACLLPVDRHADDRQRSLF
jgi:putative SOS response-associated peptidase YedK